METVRTTGSETSPHLGPIIEMDAELIDDITALVESGEQGMVLNILADLHPADLAQVLTHLRIENAQQVFLWLPVEKAGDSLTELDDEYRAKLVEEIPEERLTEILDELDSDDAADVIADLPEEVVEKVLPTLEDSEDVQELLAYDEESAGGLMATEYVAVPSHWSVAQATEEVRRNAESVEDIYVVFVIDQDGRLLGVVKLNRLLLSPASHAISDIMESDVHSVQTDLDQEEVALIMQRYDLISLPVVDTASKLVGRITIDDIVDVIRDEAEEDIQRMSGVSGGEEPTDSVIRIVSHRLPWLLAGLAGAGLAAGVIWTFHATLQEASILAGFIPIIMATAGNAGIQSSAITVQRLASGDMWATDLARRLGKEMRVALLNATISAVVLGLAILLLAPVLLGGITDPLKLATTATAALLIVIVQATAFGTLIPLILNKFEIDPALATGPFITTSNDIIGIIVFFSLAELLYL
ncbi:MAG: magnesium transporter [Bacteroidetes bacterium]|nr:magnesium transporter [Bacteroidota bacterium]MCH8246532.1 magnesium transporter [Bacteroidota bacterium]